MLYFFIFIFFLLTWCLVVAVQPCMEWIPIKKAISRWFNLYQIHCNKCIMSIIIKREMLVANVLGPCWEVSISSTKRKSARKFELVCLAWILTLTPSMGEMGSRPNFQTLNSISNHIMWTFIWKLLLHWFQACCSDDSKKNDFPKLDIHILWLNILISSKVAIFWYFLWKLELTGTVQFQSDRASYFKFSILS